MQRYAISECESGCGNKNLEKRFDKPEWDNKNAFHPFIHIIFSIMGFTLTVIGCGSATPVGHRLSSAFVLKKENSCFLIDCGEASQLHLKDNHIRMQRIEHIFISHLHGDHYFGLVGLLSSMHLFGRRAPLHLYGPPALETIVNMQLEAGCTELLYPLHFHPTQDREFALLYEDRTISVYSFPLDHGMPTTGFLFKENVPERVVPAQYLSDVLAAARPKSLPKSFAYCSDTAYNEDIIPYIKGVDLLYHEATFLESEVDLAKSRFHTTARQAAQLARKAEVKKLLVGHYSARYAGTHEFVVEASEYFSPVLPATEGLVLEI